ELAARGEEIHVFAIDERQQIQVARATARQTRANAPLVRVTLDHEREIICTPDHEFMLRDGSYRRADALAADTSLMPFYSRRDRGEPRRLSALADKAKTPEGHAYFAERGTRNILAYMAERPEHFKAAVAGNGQRGRQHLIAYNTSEKGRAKSREIANRLYECE